MPTIRSAYGAHPSQFGELHLPSSDRRPGTVIVIHGGFWRSMYDLSLGTPLAADLSGRGYATWNLEYRRVGGGGGWPATFDDVAAGIDHLATLAVDVSHVVAIGHSAGGHLATWAAGRSALPAGAPGAGPRVAVTGVASQAGVLDLATAADQRVGGSAVTNLLGATPAEDPERYRLADPIRQLPIAAPVLCLHSRRDDTVPMAQSTAYVAAARNAGVTASLIETTGDHYTMIDPRSADWRALLDALPALLSR
ncbi:MAG: alpha/beta hydrolase [Actinomycetota bacterium]|nr:alpha/beta hydrolase [Actinomycetota bacterium]